MFGVVDRVIETGQDPRRFTEDLLRRLRDLVIVAAVPDAPATGLIDVSSDQADRLVQQANHFGPAELSRAADLVVSGLTEMRGATAPRLLLELICARVLLPGADPSTTGLMARVDRLEKRASIAGGAPSPAPSARTPPRSWPSTPSTRRGARDGRAGGRVGAGGPAGAAAGTRSAEPEPEPAACRAGAAAGGGAGPARAPAPTGASARVPARAQPESGPSPPDPAAAAASGALSLVDVRRLWPDIVEATKMRRRVAWMHLPRTPRWSASTAMTLTLGFANAGARDSFVNGGCDEILRQAAIDIAGVDWRVGPSSTPAPPVARTPRARPRPRAASPPPEPPADDADEPAAAPVPPTRPRPPARRSERPPARRAQVTPPRPTTATSRPTPRHHPDDPEQTTRPTGLAGAELLQRRSSAPR